MQDNNWKITTIETAKWANSFAELLKKEPGKTFFLQGEWGSGKTEYIKKVEELTQKKLKFVYLKLWKPKDNKSLTMQLFSALFPWLSIFLTFFNWAVVIIMIGGSVWLSLKDLFPENIQWLLPATIIATIMTTLFNLTKNKVINVEDLFSWLSLKRLQRKGRLTWLRPIVLVIDDFDRIDPKMQKELYKVFNAIQEKDERARIIFIGDYDNIQKNKDNYLSKIIDQIIALPIVLNARGFAFRVEEIISKNLNEHLSGSTIKELFIDENRTLRDANQFLTYVKGEFCDQKKKGRVQTDQQLYIIYLYLFHKKHYKELYEDWLKKKDNNHESNGADKIDRYTEIVLNSDFKYPKEYRRNQPAYFINELATNHSISELIDFVENKTTELEKIMFSEKNDSDSYYPELRQFLESYAYDGSSKYYFKEIKSQLCEAAFFVMNAELRHDPNDLIKTILVKSTYTDVENTAYSGPTTGDRKYHAKKVNDSFNKIYEKFSPETSLTRLIYIYRTCFPIFGEPNDDGHDGVGFGSINRFTLTSIYFEQAEKIINEKKFGEQSYDAEALLVLLCFGPYKDDEALQFYNIEYVSVESKVDKIEQLCDTEYIAFWDAYFEKVPDYYNVSELLNFKYKGQKYADMMYNRCVQITRTVFSYFYSEEYSELGDFLKSEKWVYFILRITDKAGLNNHKHTENEKYLQIRTEIDKLLRAYNDNSMEKQLRVMEDAYSEEKELKVMQDLLDKVEKDPNWSSKC